MEKVKITVATVGQMPLDFDRIKIQRWPSDLFEITDEIESYSITNDSDGNNWEYSDQNLSNLLPTSYPGDALIALVSVPLEDNWYARRLEGNTVVFSFHEIREILRESNIPLENVIFRMLYAYTLIFKRSRRKIPDQSELTNFTHDETRRCLFDMNGFKTDVIHSCVQPIICSECIERLKTEAVSEETIAKAQKEIGKINKPLFYRIAGFIKTHPIYSMIISLIFSVVLSVFGSVVGAFVYKFLSN